MKKRKLHIAAGILILVGIAVNSFSQGLYWEGTSTQPRMGGKAASQKFYYSPGMLKVVMEEDAQRIILRMDQQRMYLVNDREKSYQEMTFDEIEKMAEKARAMMEQMNEQLAGLPPEQRKMVEEMMGKQMGAGEKMKHAVKNTGEKKTINGFSCTKHVVTLGGKDFATIWATKDVKGIDRMQKDFEEFSRRMAALAPGGAAQATDWLTEIDGFPILQESKDGGKEEVTIVEARSIAASEFDLPKGYRKVEMEYLQNEDQY
jgi:hypothetical protein